MLLQIFCIEYTEYEYTLILQVQATWESTKRSHCHTYDTCRVT